MPELKIAVRLDAFQLPLPKALHAATRSGARGVEIDARHTLRPSDLTDTAFRQLRKTLDDLNLRVAAIRFPTRHGYDQLQGLDQRVDATKAAMRMAYRLGAAVVVNQIGHVPDDPQTPAYQQLQSVMEDLGRYGTHVGAFLAAETGTEPGEQLMGLVEGVEEGFVAVAFNPANLILNSFDVRTSLGAVAKRVQVVSAVDAVRDLARGRGVEVPLGQGIADVPEMLGVLEDVQYRGWFIVGRQEPESPDEIAQAIQYLRNM